MKDIVVMVIRMWWGPLRSYCYF